MFTDLTFRKRKYYIIVLPIFQKILIREKVIDENELEETIV